MGNKKPSSDLDARFREILLGTRNSANLNSLRDRYYRFVDENCGGKTHGAKLAFCQYMVPTVPSDRDIGKDGKPGYRKHTAYMNFDWYHRKFSAPPRKRKDWQAMNENGGVVKYSTEIHDQIETGAVFGTQRKKALKLLKDNGITTTWSSPLIEKALVASDMTDNQTERMLGLILANIRSK